MNSDNGPIKIPKMIREYRIKENSKDKQPIQKISYTQGEASTSSAVAYIQNSKEAEKGMDKVHENFQEAVDKYHQGDHQVKDLSESEEEGIYQQRGNAKYKEI